ncbi:MAG: hypothetical protein CM15mV69_470 [Caudoviricetes sp.]|jgi:hypothetical protein|nr:MAG: hypothetical protein CM15mV69_470 [Caudoviricetes sp.]
MKYILILYMCSMVSGECPTSTISGWQFENHYDCVNAGYGVSQQTFRNLEDLEEWSREYIEQQKIAIRFECKELKVNA